jgi:hypothetical protein
MRDRSDAERSNTAMAVIACVGLWSKRRDRINGRSPFEIGASELRLGFRGDER